MKLFSENLESTLNIIIFMILYCHIVFKGVLFIYLFILWKIEK
ncbi:hypothetical protein LOK49_LG15G00314 [Camellia lanceoleosa]|uniref:Uncharacterized protein n=1 Tax=Camellia lanceoleosa TaxID=1840588 RepID=A0ACC0F4E3_9ERIC|nr:hypothetical protein LOK49_LG15G00314 [Camellia lanceoleosa]